MHAFDYHRPATLKDAAAFLKKNENARILGGGQSLIPVLKMRLAQTPALVDVNAIDELRAIKLHGAVLTVGAGLRHSEVATARDVLIGVPALARVAAGIGDRQVRNMGTIGGSLANSDPAACYPAAALGLGATIHTDKRNIAADSFFLGLYETALQLGEIITAVSFPVPLRAAYMKFRNPASRYAIVGVFVADSGAGVRVAVTGAAACVFRLPAMEAALSARFVPEAIAAIKVPEQGLNSDMHAQADHRAHLVTVMAMRAVEAALK